jgi:hypothetical protein
MLDRMAACPIGELVQRNGRSEQSNSLGPGLGGELRKERVQSLLRSAQRLDSSTAGQLAGGCRKSGASTPIAQLTWQVVDCFRIEEARILGRGITQHAPRAFAGLIDGPPI